MRTPAPATDGPTILVVEDDDETRAALVRELASRGYRTTEAADGGAALARWESRRPDLVLLDLGLPDIDGLDVVRRIRREATTPIVILSGRYDEREKVEALERGADDYVTKPFGVDELNARLRVALRRRRRPGRGRGRADRDRPARLRRRPPRGDGRRRAPRPDPARVRDPARPARERRAASSPRAASCAPSGARPTRARTATSTSTSASCGARSPPRTRTAGCAT